MYSTLVVTKFIYSAILPVLRVAVSKTFGEGIARNLELRDLQNEWKRGELETQAFFLPPRRAHLLALIFTS